MGFWAQAPLLTAFIFIISVGSATVTKYDTGYRKIFFLFDIFCPYKVHYQNRR